MSVLNVSQSLFTCATLIQPGSPSYVCLILCLYVIITTKHNTCHGLPLVLKVFGHKLNY